MTTGMIEEAQICLSYLFNTPQFKSGDGDFCAKMNALDYYLDRALDEATGDENCLRIRQKCLDRKSDRIKELEDSYDSALTELRKMAACCDELHEQNKALTSDLRGTEAARTDALKAFNDTQNRLTIAEDECHFLKQALDSTRSELETRIHTIEELYAENAELKAKLDKQNELILKMLYDM